MTLGARDVETRIIGGARVSIFLLIIDCSITVENNFYLLENLGKCATYLLRYVEQTVEEVIPSTSTPSAYENPRSFGVKVGAPPIVFF